MSQKNNNPKFRILEATTTTSTTTSIAPSTPAPTTTTTASTPTPTTSTITPTTLPPDQCLALKAVLDSIQNKPNKPNKNTGVLSNLLLATNNLLDAYATTEDALRKKKAQQNCNDEINLRDDYLKEAKIQLERTNNKANQAIINIDTVVNKYCPGPSYCVKLNELKNSLEALKTQNSKSITTLTDIYTLTKDRSDNLHQTRIDKTYNKTSLSYSEIFNIFNDITNIRKNSGC